MITKSKYKICRRLGPGVYEKCQTPKFVQSQARKTKRGDKRPKALSDFGTQLIEKQKVRFSYGMSEKQFSNYIKEALVTKGTPAAEALYQKLENRLDNVIYRLGIAHTRALARQMVSHGHFLVNGKRLTVPSHQVRIGDIISVREGSRGKALFFDIEKRLKSYSAPKWLTFDPAKITGTIQAVPKETEGFLNLNTVFEFYSR